MPPNKQIAVLGSFLTNPQSSEYAMAEELGYLLAENGFEVVCGGHGGIAHPLVSGMTRGGGKVRGIAMNDSRFPGRNAKMDPRITEIIKVDSIAERLEVLAGADGYIFFTGGIGTLTEFAFIWHSLQVTKTFTKPLILVAQHWIHLLAGIRQEQMIKHKYYRVVYFCEQAKEALAILTNDYSIKYGNVGCVFHKEAALFDLEGTIVESPEEVFIRICENHGYFFRPPDVLAAFRKTRHFPTPPEEETAHARSLLEQLGITGKSATDLAADLSREFSQLPALHDDVVDTLDYFKASGFFTAILSSRPLSRVREILASHSLSCFFDFIGTLDRTGEKSMPGLLEELLTVSGVQRDGFIHIADDLSGDNPGPASLGVQSILLDRFLVNLLDTNTVTIRSLGELKYLVKRRSTT
jgi:predicted Rossmann-fold nucleotide-binding protein/FMN phosphatase YigB (HAD superfamily)